MKSYSRLFRKPNLFPYYSCVLILLLYSCGKDEKEAGQIPQGKPVVPGQVEKERTSGLFVSNDRKQADILSDYKKPLNSYPAITSNESKARKDGLIYRDGIETPFTGRIIDRFDDGAVMMDSSYLEGQPHGLQARYFKNGNPALEATFDKGTLSGIKSRWWENGLIREEEYWSEGRYRGRRLWDEVGRLIREEITP